MSRKYKWFLNIMMLAVMVIAMVAACGSKKEEAAEPEKKEEKTVETETDEVNQEKSEENEIAIDDEKNEFGFTDSQITDLLIAIQSAVLTEYLVPNEIDPADFSWPDGMAEYWRYLSSRLMAYQYGSEVEMPDDVSQDMDTRLMKPVYDAIITWFEENGLDESRFQNMGNLLLMFEPLYEKFPMLITLC